ncbi:threonine aldolase [Silvimonas terrae]|uniref:L-threonine aldolase n=1 Tax=Silvimonas terrae TaxID=300266 RepID=A0A840RDN8_9NEIS|nr:low specificity L-threonine aldolase [Silvimonas terrae]MBB5190480.1 threonine aldolase [Silvimonas terrae]
MQKTAFASDNTSGICPEALESFIAANTANMASYGNDEWTRRACDAIRDLFQTDCDVFFVFNGTAANSLALASLVQSYHSIICHKLSHVETDECGGPEFFSNGTKLLLAEGEGGKLDVEGIARLVAARTDIHYPKPRAVTITQSTEVGTVYSLAEVQAIGATCREMGLAFHMDGARFANAVAHLGVSPAELTWKAGVDVLSFGGTKMGMPVGEAVVFFNHQLAQDFAYRCKQAGQLASKMRFLAAPWVGMLQDNAWLKRATHANAMATRLSDALAALPGVSLMFPTQANAVFVNLPANAAQVLKEKGWAFYSFIGAGGARFVCSWATTVEEVDTLVADVQTGLSVAG